MLQWEEWIKYYKTKTIYDTSQKRITESIIFPVAL